MSRKSISTINKSATITVWRSLEIAPVLLRVGKERTRKKKGSSWFLLILHWWTKHNWPSAGEKVRYDKFPLVNVKIILSPESYTLL